jgi:hypothetical protein
VPPQRKRQHARGLLLFGLQRRLRLVGALLVGPLVIRATIANAHQTKRRSCTVRSVRAAPTVRVRATLDKPVWATLVALPSGTRLQLIARSGKKRPFARVRIGDRALTIRGVARASDFQLHLRYERTALANVLTLTTSAPLRLQRVASGVTLTPIVPHDLFRTRARLAITVDCQALALGPLRGLPTLYQKRRGLGLLKGRWVAISARARSKAVGRLRLDDKTEVTALVHRKARSKISVAHQGFRFVGWVARRALVTRILLPHKLSACGGVRSARRFAIPMRCRKAMPLYAIDRTNARFVVGTLQAKTPFTKLKTNKGFTTISLETAWLNLAAKTRLQLETNALFSNCR